MKLTQEKLKELLDYDHETGVFTWKISRGTAKKGKIAGRIDKINGYIDIVIDRKLYKSHRLVFLYIDGYLPENVVDHINRNKTDNRRNNLREVSQTCNTRNKSLMKNNKSGITGIGWHKRDKKWWSQIMVFGKQIHLGYFDNIVDAAKSRWNAEVKYGFPNCNTTSSAYNYLKEYGAI